MSVTFSTSEILWGQTKEPCLTITINNGFQAGSLQGRTLHITKEHPKGHLWDTHGPNCDATISICLQTPTESQAFEDKMRHFMRADTCDEVIACVENHTCTLRLPPKVALQALKTATEVSPELLQAQEKWYEKAKEFIENGPQPREIVEKLNPDLETQIRQKLGDQPGAINLLADLKQKPYSRDVSSILSNMLLGKYGEVTSYRMNLADFLAAHLTECGFADLAAKAKAEYYEHNGPDAAQHMNQIIENMLPSTPVAPATKKEETPYSALWDVARVISGFFSRFLRLGRY